MTGLRSSFQRSEEVVPDVLFFVLFGHQDVGAVWLQVVRRDLPQDLHVYREVHLQTTLLDVVVPEENNNSFLFNT